MANKERFEERERRGTEERSSSEPCCWNVKKWQQRPFDRLSKTKSVENWENWWEAPRIHLPLPTPTPSPLYHNQQNNNHQCLLKIRSCSLWHSISVCLRWQGGAEERLFCKQSRNSLFHHHLLYHVNSKHRQYKAHVSLLSCHRLPSIGCHWLAQKLALQA